MDELGGIVWRGCLTWGSLFGVQGYMGVRGCGVDWRKGPISPLLSPFSLTPAPPRHYPKILALLAGGSTQESSARVRDNVCGAVARMVLSQPQALPLSQVRGRNGGLPREAGNGALGLASLGGAGWLGEGRALLL